MVPVKKLETAAQSQAERVAVARDLHDSVGHSTSVVSIHADVAREALARGDTLVAEEALRLVKETTMAAMSDLRRTVMLLCSSEQDRKSTRLNSSHVSISYAVFCLRKKKPMALATTSLVG